MSDNIHRVYSDRKIVRFLSFKNGSDKSTPDEILLPPEEGFSQAVMWHNFGTWLKREGHGWETMDEEQLCRLATEYFNKTLRPGELPRRFDRMITPPQGQ